MDSAERRLAVEARRRPPLSTPRHHGPDRRNRSTACGAACPGCYRTGAGIQRSTSHGRVVPPGKRHLDCSAALASYNTACTLRATIRSDSSVGASSGGRSGMIPASLTTESTLPSWVLVPAATRWFRRDGASHGSHCAGHGYAIHTANTGAPESFDDHIR